MALSTKDAQKILAFLSELMRGAQALEGVGLREIAKATGVSISTLSRINRGRGGVPDAITLFRLVDWLRRTRRL